MKDLGDTVIDVRALKKRYGDVQAVDGMAFDVRKGEIFGMLGPNGAGKTTTVEIVEGLRSADEGSVTVLGKNVSKDRNCHKQDIGVQLQTTALFPELTVREVLSLFGSFYDRSLSPDELIEMVDLGEKRKCKNSKLSGGQQQRLSVALAMVNDPQIVFLDEPTTGLDPQARRSLWDTIKELQARGKTVLLTTHYMEEAERLCDRVAIVDHGKIIALNSPHDLVTTYFKVSGIEFDTFLTVATNNVLLCRVSPTGNDDDSTTFTRQQSPDDFRPVEVANGHSSELHKPVCPHLARSVFLKLTAED